MPIPHYESDNRIQGIVDVEDIHARTGNHDVTRAHVRHLQRPLDDRERIRIEQRTFVGGPQESDEFIAVFRFRRKQRCQTFQQRGFILGKTGVVHFTHIDVWNEYSPLPQAREGERAKPRPIFQKPQTT